MISMLAGQLAHERQNALLAEAAQARRVRQAEAAGHRRSRLPFPRSRSRRVPAYPVDQVPTVDAGTPERPVPA
jgi:hypothetical protein